MLRYHPTRMVAVCHRDELLEVDLWPESTNGEVVRALLPLDVARYLQLRLNDDLGPLDDVGARRVRDAASDRAV